MEKRDLRKELKHLYTPKPGEVQELTVPPLKYLAVDGQGDPSQPGDFQDAIKALYPAAFTIKFAVKKGPLATDYPVMPLQALWWADDWAVYARGERVEWKWRAMILVPEFVTSDMAAEAVEAVRAKKGDLPQLGKVHLEEFDEGLCAQIMHVGPYSGEAENIQKVHEYIGEVGRNPWGAHHEIYLSDPSRTKPENMKTIIRQPMR